MNSVVHFELPAKDRERMAKFYTRAFGWKTQAFGEEMGNYVLATTTDSDEAGRPKTPGAINGGFFKAGEGLDSCARVVVGVDDIATAIAAVKEAGGSVFGEPQMIPGVGLYVVCRDTEANPLGILQPIGM